MRHRILPNPQPEGWGFLLAQFDAHLAACGHTPQTRETRLEHMRRIARRWPTGPDTITTESWATFNADNSHWSREHRRSIRASLHRFFTWYNPDLDPTTNLPPILPREPCPRPCPEDILAQALTNANTRETLILRLAAEAGLRRIEISRLKHSDLVSLGNGPAIIVQGKADKTRIVPINQELAARIRLHEPTSQWVFPNHQGNHLTPRHIGRLASSLLPKPWTLHTLRHRYAAKTHETGDLLTVQKLLGHSSPATTQRYTPVRTDRLRQAAELAAIS